MAEAQDLVALSRRWINESAAMMYTYHFEAFGRPIIQFPQDMVALSELIWEVRPDLIVETGIAHGGSLVYSASQLGILDLCDSAQSGGFLDLSVPKRQVLGIDIDIRKHQRVAIESHPLARYISMIEGSSTDESIAEQVATFSEGFERVMVLLDSNHTHEHVLSELNHYAPLVTPGSYCVVFDTVIEFMDDGSFPDRDWGVGDNPYTAVEEFLRHNQDFEVVNAISDKLQITVAPGGYLRRL